MLRTERLTLIPAQPNHLESLIAGQTTLDGFYGNVAEGYLEFPGILEHSLEQLQAGKAEPEWWTYLFIYRDDETLVGLGGYKGAPGSDGVVEIGYGIAPTYRNRGLATEAIQALVQHAFGDERTRMVIAHTLARSNPSTRALTKCGLLPVTEHVDPEMGPIWRWEIRR